MCVRYRLTEDVPHHLPSCALPLLPRHHHHFRIPVHLACSAKLDEQDLLRRPCSIVLHARVRSRPLSPSRDYCPLTLISCDFLFYSVFIILVAVTHPHSHIRSVSSIVKRLHAASNPHLPPVPHRSRPQHTCSHVGCPCRRTRLSAAMLFARCAQTFVLCECVCVWCILSNLSRLISHSVPKHACTRTHCHQRRFSFSLSMMCIPRTLIQSSPPLICA